MSVEPKRLAEQIEARNRQQARAREQETVAPVIAEMKIGGTTESREALQSLMRNALAGAAPVGEPELSVTVVGVTGDLERDGCDFVKMAFLFLAILECPAECRDFVLAVCALSGGEADDFRAMPDEQIAELIGYSRKYVRQKREALIEWQKTSTYALVDIQENERDPATRHFLPTEYRPRIVPCIAQFIRRARSLRARSADYAQKQAIEHGYHEIVGELSSELPIAPLVRRRKGKTFTRPKENQMTLMHGQREKLILNVERHLRRALDLGHNPREVWTDIQREVEIAVYKMTLNTEWRE